MVIPFRAAFVLLNARSRFHAVSPRMAATEATEVIEAATTTVFIPKVSSHKSRMHVGRRMRCYCVFALQGCCEGAVVE